jgi:hypothetical protein
MQPSRNGKRGVPDVPDVPDVPEIFRAAVARQDTMLPCPTPTANCSTRQSSILKV